MIDKITTNIANGNPGAIGFMMRLENSSVSIKHKAEIIAYLIENDIRGTDAYVLWSDLADKELHLVYKLIKLVPRHVLKKATTKQDYSGCSYPEIKIVIENSHRRVESL